MFKFLKRDGETLDAPSYTEELGGAAEAASARARGPMPDAGTGGADDERITKESRKLNLVNRNLLLSATDQAVRRGVSKYVPGLEAKVLDSIVLGTRTELVRLLKQSSRSVRGMPKAAFLREVEEDRAKILAEREQVQAEIERMMEQLAERRQEAEQYEQQLVWESRQEGIQQDEELTKRIFEMFGGTDATHEMAAIREQVTFLLLQQLNQERDKVVDAQMAERRHEVEHFERRISKLTRSLELTEEELQRMAKAKGIDPGVASIYRTVQGLDDAEGNYEAKLEMMASIFEANLALQKKGAGQEG
jgi:hypothetical protein